MRWVEVADTNAFDFAFLERILQAEPCLVTTLRPGGGVVDQVKIYVIQAQAGQRFLDSVVGPLACVLVVPDLGGDINGGA